MGPSSPVPSWARTLEIAPLMLAAIIYCVVLVSNYSSLPPTLAIHYGLNGQPNGWIERQFWAILSIALLAILIAVPLFASITISTSGARYAPVVKLYLVFGIVLSGFFQIVAIGVGTQPSLSIVRSLTWGVGSAVVGFFSNLAVSSMIK